MIGTLYTTRIFFEIFKFATGILQFFIYTYSLNDTISYSIDNDDTGSTCINFDSRSIERKVRL